MGIENNYCQVQVSMDQLISLRQLGEALGMKEVLIGVVKEGEQDRIVFMAIALSKEVMEHYTSNAGDKVTVKL